MKIKETVTLAFLSSILVGCQSTSNVDDGSQGANSIVAQQNIYLAQFEVIEKQQQKWESRLVSINDYNLYSSNLVNSFKRSLNDATAIYKEVAANPSLTVKDYSFFSSGTYGDKYHENITNVEQAFEQLTNLKQQADIVLSEATTQIEYLNKIEANKVFPSQYKEILDSYHALFSFIENNRIDRARVAQTQFLVKSKTFEISVINHKYVKPLNDILALHTNKRLNRLAPQTFNKASAEIKKVAFTIQSNPRDIESIQEVHDIAKFELERVTIIADEVSKLSLVRNNRFEHLVLGYESNLNAISKELNETNYTNKPFNTQVQKMIASLKLKQKNNSLEQSGQDEMLKGLHAEIDSLKYTLSQLNTNLSKKEKEIEFERRQNESLSKLLLERKSSEGQDTVSLVEPENESKVVQDEVQSTVLDAEIQSPVTTNSADSLVTTESVSKPVVTQNVVSPSESLILEGDPA